MGIRSFWIIPTGVGKRNDVREYFEGSKDHPHGRGEKRAVRRGGQLSDGSSPRAWGKGTEQGPKLPTCRIIPTGVGKRPDETRVCTEPSDHPHGRGEKNLSARCGTILVGSSPRAWGKVKTAAPLGAEIRIIPTGVGKSGQLPSSSLCGPDHPHGRGEK